MATTPRKIHRSLPPVEEATKPTPRDEKALTIVERWEDVPAFTTEADEQEFWSTHGLGDMLLGEFKPVPEEGDDDLPPARISTRASENSAAPTRRH